MRPAPDAVPSPVTTVHSSFLQCRCVWMPRPPSLMLYRRHANGATAAVAARVELGQDRYMAGAAPVGEEDWHALVVGLEAARG